MKYLPAIVVLSLAGFYPPNAEAWCLWEDYECCLEKAADKPTEEGVAQARSQCEEKYRKDNPKYIRCQEASERSMTLAREACLKDPEQQKKARDACKTIEDSCMFEGLIACQMPRYIYE